MTFLIVLVVGEEGGIEHRDDLRWQSSFDFFLQCGNGTVRMQQPKEPKSPRWWTRGPRTSRHLYFYPTNNVPGVLLFALIFLLGCWALAIVIFHAMKTEHLVRQDVVLAGIGVVSATLGLAQIRRLLKKEE